MFFRSEQMCSVPENQTRAKNSLPQHEKNFYKIKNHVLFDLKHLKKRIFARSRTFNPVHLI